MTEKLRDVCQIFAFIRAILRLGFVLKLFELATRGFLQDAEVDTENISDSDQYEALRGRHKPLLETYPESASSGVLSLSPETLATRNLNKSLNQTAALQLSPKTLRLPRDHLKYFIEILSNLHS